MPNLLGLAYFRPERTKKARIKDSIVLETIVDKIRELEHSKNRTKYLTTYIIVSIISIVFSLIFDRMVTNHEWYWNMLRTLIAVIGAVPTFLIAHYVTSLQSNANKLKAKNNDVDYLEYRLRYSPATRMKQSAIVGSIIILIAIITSYTTVYTLCGMLAIIGFISIIFYCRLTPDEKILRQYEVPDPRDIVQDYLNNNEEDVEVEDEDVSNVKADAENVEK